MNYPDLAFREAVVPVPAPRPLPATVTKELVKQAEQDLTRLKELDAETQRRGKIAARIEAEQALAEATQVLLTNIRQLVVDQVRTVNGFKALAHFIKELQPLAKTYGVKIVKVGNGELATLVLAPAK